MNKIIQGVNHLHTNFIKFGLITATNIHNALTNFRIYNISGKWIDKSVDTVQ